MSMFRYAHSEGHTDVCYTDNSKNIITCGSEGDVRIWSGINDADQRDICVGEAAWAVAQKGKSMYVGTDANIIQAYTFPELETDGIISRFTAPVTQIDVSRNGQKVVAGSSDMEIHLVDLSTMESKKFLGHKAPVLSVVIHPEGEFIASSSCDGTVKVWQASTAEIIKQWDCLEKCNSFELAKSICRIHFSPNGRFLGVPKKSHIRLHEQPTWDQVQTLSADSAQDFCVMRFSPNCKMVVGGTTTGDLYIWDIATEKILKHVSDSSFRSITAISWKSDSKSLVYCNVAGQLSEVELPNMLDTMEVSEEDLASVPLGVPELIDDDDDDDENVISLEKIKAESSFYENNKDPDASSQDGGKVESDILEDREVDRIPRIPISELQQPFQPSSTPLHLLQRFMVWNNVGIVRQFSSDDTNEIDVEFHDTSIHHSFRINNILGHTVAALSSKALILACPKTIDSSSKIVCILMRAWDGQKEWDVNLNEEEVVAVACGDDWVAAATDKNYLRIFTNDGTQTDIYSIPGPLVCITGMKNELAVVFHNGIGLEGEQILSFCKLRINRKGKLLFFRSLNPLPISPKSTLKWLGFTDEGSLSSLDSNGILRVMYGKIWRPINELDSNSKSKYDHYFVIGISEMNQNVRCILCKGAYYPPVLPKPVVTEVDWQVPLCELDSEKGSLEQKMLQSLITLPNITIGEVEEEEKRIEKSISVTVMKLFALACRSGLEARAITLCESMQSVSVVELAGKYAAKLGRHQLAERISSVAIKMSSNSTPEMDGNMENEEEEEPEKDEKQEYSQDLFDDTNIASRENLILKMQNKKKLPSPKPSKILIRQDNPFKKNRVIESSENQSENSTSDVKLNFMEWYAKNRSTLQEEYPLLRESELAIAGMKRYKQQTISKQLLNTSQDDVIESTPPEHNETKKRKLSPKKGTDTESVPKKLSTSSKLKSFSFNKKN